MTREGQDKIRDQVNDRMMAALETGTVPWHMPWRRPDGSAMGLPMRMSNNRPYRGSNIWVLGLTAMMMGYTSSWWGSYDQIAKLSGMVEEPMMRDGEVVLYKSGKRKGEPRMHWVSPDGTLRGVREGEKSTMVTLNRRYTYEDRNDLDEQGKPKRKVGYTLRMYSVFNADQANALPARYHPVQGAVTEPVVTEGIEEVDLVLKTYGATLAGGWTHNRDGRAWYQKERDQINTPPAEDYESVAERYSTEFHEAGHSTGHKDRLNRKSLIEWAGFGSEPYADEELTAEMTSALMCAIYGIDGAFDNSAAYIAGWLRKLRNDNGLVITASARAQRAADLIMGVTFEDEEGGGTSEEV